MHSRNATTRTRVLKAAHLGATLASLMLLMLAGAALGGRGVSTAWAAPHATPTATSTASVTPTTTATTTTTPSPTAATLTLASPASAQGPVGAHLTFSGARWSGTRVSLTAATTSCASPDGSLGEAPISATKSFTTTIIWPTTLTASGTAYLLCATSDTGVSVTGDQQYRIRSAAPAALSVSLTDAGVGQDVEINGINFIGAASVTLSIETPKGKRTLATLAPDPKDGSFVHSYVPASGDQGSATLTASSSPDGSAPSALQASATLAVGPALPPTATVAPTAAPISSPVIVTRRSSAGLGDNILAELVLLAIGGFLLLLALVGVIAWLTLRPRRAASPRAGVGRMGSPAPPAPARGQTARAPAVGGAPHNGAIGRLWAEEPWEDESWEDEPAEATSPLTARRPRTMGDLVRSHAAAYGNSGNGQQNGHRNGSRDDAHWSVATQDEEPAAPGDSSYFGLPPLESRDAAAPYPNGHGRPDAWE